MSGVDVVRERLIADIDRLVEDIEELVNATAESSNDGAIASVRRKISQTIASAKNSVAQAKTIFAVSRQGAEAVVSYTSEHCWARVAVQAGAAMALACVLRSRWLRSHQRSQVPVP
jgi:ElaB/YqjD/DUF883 family membrane-anchored ribosome-binding protein